MEQCLGETVTIGESKFGKGIYAERTFTQSTPLIRITGSPMNFEDTVVLGPKESHSLQIGLRNYILVQTPFLFSNHSCDPNCGINEHLELITIRPVSKGEELTWDYSTSMLERHWTMKCNCGAERCRRIVEDFDRIPESIQKEYIEKKIVLPFILQTLHPHRVRFPEAFAFK